MGSNNSRLFKGLKFHGRKFSKSVEQHLACAMLKRTAAGSTIAAGHTYLGQLISHELNPSTDGRRTLTSGPVIPRLNFDSLYGDEKFQLKALTKPNGKFKLGESISGIYGDDVFRDKFGPLIAESRNDENYLLSQMLLLWMKFHNVVYDVCFNDSSLSIGERFKATRAFVTQVLHHVIVDDFLKSILEEHIFKLYCSQNRRFILRNSVLKNIPAEFSHGVFRFGHSMIRKAYTVQRSRNPQIPFGPSILTREFFVSDHAKKIADDLVVDWSLLFEIKANGKPLHPAEKIDTRMTDVMGGIPNKPLMPSIVELNLKADVEAKIPTGWQIIHWICENQPELAKTAKLTADSGYVHPRFFGDDFAVFNCSIPEDKIPLWIYILLEKVGFKQGARLGKLGSIVTAEVIMNAIDSTELFKGAGQVNQKLRSKVHSQLEVFNSTEPWTMLKVIKFVDENFSQTGE